MVDAGASRNRNYRTGAVQPMTPQRKREINWHVALFILVQLATLVQDIPSTWLRAIATGIICGCVGGLLEHVIVESKKGSKHD